MAPEQEVGVVAEKAEVVTVEAVYITDVANEAMS